MRIEPLLTPAATGEILGVAIQTLAIWRSTKRYDLKWVKIGGRVRYRASEVQAFLDRNVRTTS